LADWTHRDRRHVAVVITSDGRRVPMPVDSGLVDGSLLELITGSRREDGGTRRTRDR
jgi:hypothetical protein